ARRARQHATTCRRRAPPGWRHGSRSGLPRPRSTKPHAPRPRSSLPACVRPSAGAARARRERRPRRRRARRAARATPWASVSAVLPLPTFAVSRAADAPTAPPMLRTLLIHAVLLRGRARPSSIVVLCAGQDQELDIRIGTSWALRDLQGFAA